MINVRITFDDRTVVVPVPHPDIAYVSGDPASLEIRVSEDQARWIAEQIVKLADLKDVPYHVTVEPTENGDAT